MDSPLLEQLYRRHSRSVFRRASAIMGDCDDAKDAMQDVFLRAFEAHAEFTEAASPLSWLYRITTNICLNRLRDSSRRRGILGRFWCREQSIVISTSDTALTVRALVGCVPQPIQEIAVLYFVDQMSQEEIAALLDVSRRTVGYRLEEFRSLTMAAAREEGIGSS